jgi:uncharacterized tellurite resistance protein B-like protein
MMSDKNLILTLAKVIIAAAWADGEVTLEEINSLKYLLFQLPRVGYKQGTRITGREWTLLEMYIESPVDATERARLVEELKVALRTPRDRELAISALEDMVSADDVITDEELAVLREIKSALEAVDLGIINQLGRLIRGPVQRHSHVVANGSNREESLEDFIRNKVYYVLSQRLEPGAADLNVPEPDLRKLCLVAGLMARVAHTDQQVTEDQIAIMTNALRAEWETPQEVASLVADIALSEADAGLDYYRLTQELFSSTKETERIRFLDVFFTLANADGQISHKEHEEIRHIASSLSLSHQLFIDAKLRILES